MLQQLQNLISSVWFSIKAIWGQHQLYRQQEGNHRKTVARLLDYYEGRALFHLQRLIARLAPRNAGRVTPFAETRNMVKEAVDLVQPFKHGISIVATSKDPKTKAQDQALIDFIVDQNRYDLLLADIATKVELCGTIPVRVYDDVENEDKPYPCIEVMTPLNVGVQVNKVDPSDIDAVTYGVVSADDDSIGPEPIGDFWTWTKDKYYESNQLGRPKLLSLNTGNVNPFHVIPFVFFRISQPSIGFWTWPDQSIVLNQDMIGWAMTMYNFIVTRQSWGIGQAFGLPKTSEIDAWGDLVRFDAIPKDERAGIEFVTPQAALDHLRDSVDKRVEWFLARYGVNPADLKASAERSSAETLQFSSAKLEEIRSAYRIHFSFLQQSLWKLIAVVHNTYADERKLPKFSDDFSVEVKYSTVKQVDQKVDDKIKDWDWALQHNLTTLPDIMVENSTDLDRATAEVKIIENSTINRRIATLVLAVQQPSGSVPAQRPSGSSPVFTIGG